MDNPPTEADTTMDNNIDTIEGFSNDVIVFLVGLSIAICITAVLVGRHSRTPTPGTANQIHASAVSDIRTFQQSPQSTARRNSRQPTASTAQNIGHPTDESNSINTCPICLDNCTLEVLTNCGHSFCGNCIINYWEHAGSLRGTLPCPCCRQHLTMLHGATPTTFTPDNNNGGGQSVTVQNR